MIDLAQRTEHGGFALHDGEAVVFDTLTVKRQILGKSDL